MVDGDYMVSIGHDSAVLALEAMETLAKQGHYKELMADEASFVREAIYDLHRASGTTRDDISGENSV